MTKAGRKLFTVEETIMISERGLLAIFGPPFSTFGTDGQRHSCAVEVKRPAGSVLVTQTDFYRAHFSPREAQKRYLERGCYACLCKGATKTDVSTRSEVWEADA